MSLESCLPSLDCGLDEDDGGAGEATASAAAAAAALSLDFRGGIEILFAVVDRSEAMGFFVVSLFFSLAAVTLSRSRFSLLCVRKVLSPCLQGKKRETRNECEEKRTKKDDGEEKKKKTSKKKL